MLFPVANLLFENGANQRVVLRPAVKSSHKAVDHWLIDAGSSNNVGNDRIAASLTIL